MKVRLIRPRAGCEVGDETELPDGAQVSDLYYEIVAESPSPAPSVPSPAPAAASPVAAATAPANPASAPKAGA